MNDLIRRCDAIDAVDKRLKELWNHKPFNQSKVICVNGVKNFIYQIPSANQWIPTNEKLPEEKGWYWVCTDTNYQCQCKWTNINPIWNDGMTEEKLKKLIEIGTVSANTKLKTDWHWDASDIPKYSKVIAWMPLPKPYEE